MPEHLPPIHLRVIDPPDPKTRTVVRQREANTPVFKGRYPDGYSDIVCGTCSNILAVRMSLRGYKIDGQKVRLLPPPSGGVYSVLSLQIERDETIYAKGGIVLECGSCGAFSEFVADSSPDE